MYFFNRTSIREWLPTAKDFVGRFLGRLKESYITTPGILYPGTFLPYKLRVHNKNKDLGVSRQQYQRDPPHKLDGTTSHPLPVRWCTCTL